MDGQHLDLELVRLVRRDPHLLPAYDEGFTDDARMGFLIGWTSAMTSVLELVVMPNPEVKG